MNRGILYISQAELFCLHISIDKQFVQVCSLKCMGYKKNKVLEHTSSLCPGKEFPPRPLSGKLDLVLEGI